MIQISEQQRRHAFSVWLRTGRLPSARVADGIELKFNPWHDPDDGRFTFTGSGGNFGRGEETKPTGSIGRRLPRPSGRPAQPSGRPVLRDGVEARVQRPSTAPAAPKPRPNAVTEFVGGVGEGIYDVAADTAGAAYAAVTTNPVTTVGDIGRGVAGMIDSAVAAEDTPARIQLSRAANAVANASARDVGHAVGSVAGNMVLTVGPGATVGKLSAARRLRMARPRPGPFPPAQVGWVKEDIVSKEDWKIYNDSATGARPGQAPVLRRTMSDGSTRPVKFDGVEGDTLIDRKWSVSGKPRSRAQALRQSEALAQNRLIAVWEVPTDAKRLKGIKLLKKWNITNIKIRVVKP